MTLILQRSKNIEIKTFSVGRQIVNIFGTVEAIQIDMEDFSEMVMYVLTNTDLAKNDPRLELLKRMKALKRIKGFNLRSRRLGT